MSDTVSMAKMPTIIEVQKVEVQKGAQANKTAGTRTWPMTC